MKSGRKKRTISIRWKILIPTIITVCVLASVISTSAFRAMREGMISIGMEQAHTVAKFSVDSVDGDILKTLDVGCDETKEYQEIFATLSRLQKEYGIAYLYTLYTDGETVFYGVDSDSTENHSLYGDECEMTYEELKDSFEGEAYIADYIDSTIYGDLISAYLPIYDSEGNVVAVLGSDYDAANILRSLNENILKTTIVTLVGLGVAIVVLIIILQIIIKTLAKVDYTLGTIVGDKIDLSQELKITTGDELEDIGDNINTVLHQMKSVVGGLHKDSNDLSHSGEIIVDAVENTHKKLVDISNLTEHMNQWFSVLFFSLLFTPKANVHKVSITCN